MIDLMTRIRIFELYDVDLISLIETNPKKPQLHPNCNPFANLLNRLFEKYLKDNDDDLELK